MNPVTIFLTIGTLYLAIVAYGVVGTRKRGLPASPAADGARRSR